MAFELKQNLKLAQQLVMTPQLQQAIKLLQLSRLELVDMIQQEMEENPLLEEETPEEYQAEETAADSGEDADIAEREEAKVVERTEEVSGEGDGKDDFDWNNYLEDYGPVGVRYDREREEALSWDNMLTVKPSLTDHLMWQLKLARFTELEMKIGEQIICNLDYNGYLNATTEEISLQAGVDGAFVEAVLKKVQDFDPPGIAARDIKECLLIQAKIFGITDPLIAMIINNHMKDLEIKNYPNIARKLKIPMDSVMQAVMLISNMNPKPGSLYQTESAVTIVPDVFVFKASDEYKILLNDEGLPRLRISNFYRDIMGGINQNHDSESGRRYIKERMQSAAWLIKSIQQRHRTIYKVAESILKFQRDFFDYGLQHLKPLVLRDIADDVEMHESTISRVVTNKYMHTPRGIFELKFFFSSSIHKTDGDSLASKSVREEIRKIIVEENQKKPLSDNDIVEKLEKLGISIARRTVAKYREMMGVLPSSKRKKYF
jgi:RNA polymerase sigma-54 factor